MKFVDKNDKALVSEICMRNVNFYYGKVHALKNIQLDIFRSNVTAFIGPSGCGKSTLLRTINRMYDLYPGQRAEGEVVVDGKNILAEGVDTIALRAKVGMVFQNLRHFPCLFMKTLPSVCACMKNCRAMRWMIVSSGL